MQILFLALLLAIAKSQPEDMFQEQQIFKKNTIKIQSLPSRGTIVMSTATGSSIGFSEEKKAEINNMRESLRMKNQKLVDSINSDPTKTYKAKLNSFGSLTEQEIRQLYLTLNPSTQTSKLYERVITEKKKLDQLSKLGKGTIVRSTATIAGQNNMSINIEPTTKTPSLLDKVNLDKLRSQFSQEIKQYYLKQKKLNEIEIDSFLPKIEIEIKQAKASDSSKRLLQDINNTLENQKKNTVIKSDNNFDIDWTCVSGRVKFQGNCGACYAFSAAGSLSSALAIYDYTFYFQLSVQQIVSCGKKYDDFLILGCRGGFLQGPFSYMKMEGVYSDFNYPYTSRLIENKMTESCRSIDNKIKKWKISDHGLIEKGNCQELRDQLQRQPISIAISFFKLQYYKTGIFNDCDENDPLDHAVLLVGYKAGKGWKIKNSWGTGWGEQGFGWINEHKNCRICQIGMYPILLGEAHNNYEKKQMLRTCKPPS